MESPVESEGPVEEVDSDDDLTPYTIPPENRINTKAAMNQPKYLQDCYDGKCYLYRLFFHDFLSFSLFIIIFRFFRKYFQGEYFDFFKIFWFFSKKILIFFDFLKNFF